MSGERYTLTEAGMLARDDPEAWVQLVTKVPQDLHRRAKLHAIATDQTLLAFIVAALRDRLARVATEPTG